MNNEEFLRDISPENLLNYGVRQIAYVKNTDLDGENIFEVHTAAGEEIARFADRDVAFAVCQQNDLQPLSVH